MGMEMGLGFEIGVKFGWELELDSDSDSESTTFESELTAFGHFNNIRIAPNSSLNSLSGM